MQEASWYENVTIPALLRHARTPFGEAIRTALEEAGYDEYSRKWPLHHRRLGP